MSTQSQGGAGSGILGLLMLLGIGSCVFGGSEDSEKQAAAAAPTKTNTVDAPFSMGNPGLQAAHNQSGSGDGFRIVILMQSSKFWETITATEVSHHQYDVICSSGSDGPRLRFTKFNVNTDTGSTVQIGGTS